VRVDAEHATRAVAVIAEYGLTAYDASYVAAARARDWTSTSTDIKDLVSRGLAVAPDAVDVQPRG
jgi:hypothetical protein